MGGRCGEGESAITKNGASSAPAKEIDGTREKKREKGEGEKNGSLTSLVIQLLCVSRTRIG